jgi:hypothetical protein
MDKVKTLAEKLDPCIVGDIGAFLTYLLVSSPELTETTYLE